MRLDLIQSELVTLLAVETLEYHDKNWLAGDNKTRNEAKQEILKDCINRIDKHTGKEGIKKLRE